MKLSIIPRQDFKIPWILETTEVVSGSQDGFYFEEIWHILILYAMFLASCTVFKKYISNSILSG